MPPVVREIGRLAESDAKYWMYGRRLWLLNIRVPMRGSRRLGGRASTEAEEAALLILGHW